MHAAGSAPLVMRNARLQRIAQRKFIARVVLAAGLVLAIVATYGVDRSLEEIARQRLAMAARSAATKGQPTRSPAAPAALKSAGRLTAPNPRCR